MAFKPVMMKDVHLSLGDEATGPQFQCQATSVSLKPQAQVQKLKTLCPEGRYADVEASEWELEIGYAVGEDDGQGTVATILSEYLLEHHGQKQAFRFRPRSGGKGFGGTVTLLAGPVGGSQGNWMEGSVTLPLDGQPTVLPKA